MRFVKELNVTLMTLSTLASRIAVSANAVLDAFDPLPLAGTLRYPEFRKNAPGFRQRSLNPEEPERVLETVAGLLLSAPRWIDGNPPDRPIPLPGRGTPWRLDHFRASSVVAPKNFPFGEVIFGSDLGKILEIQWENPASPLTLRLGWISDRSIVQQILIFSPHEKSFRVTSLYSFNFNNQAIEGLRRYLNLASGEIGDVVADLGMLLFQGDFRDDGERLGSLQAIEDEPENSALNPYPERHYIVSFAKSRHDRVLGIETFEAGDARRSGPPIHREIRIQLGSAVGREEPRPLPRSLERIWNFGEIAAMTGEAVFFQDMPRA